MYANGRTYLRVKIRSLATEARIIRHEERRAKSAKRRDLVAGLVEHRRGAVRREARAAQLAAGFLRGRQISQIEPKNRPGNRPDWKRVGQLVARYGEPGMDQRLSEWADRRSSM